jgi:hypothetical protein
MLALSNKGRFLLVKEQRDAAAIQRPLPSTTMTLHCRSCEASWMDRQIRRRRELTIGRGDLLSVGSNEVKQQVSLPLIDFLVPWGCCGV